MSLLLRFKSYRYYFSKGYESISHKFLSKNHPKNNIKRSLNPAGGTAKQNVDSQILDEKSQAVNKEKRKKLALKKKNRENLNLL